MIDYYTTDDQRIYSGAVQIDPYGPLPTGTITPPPDTAGDCGGCGTLLTQEIRAQWVAKLQEHFYR